MDITITGRKMPITDALRDYAEEKIGNAMKVMDIDPLTAEVVLEVEKNPANPTPACCEVTMRARGHIIRVEEHEENMYAAIDVASAKVLRQLRKYKTRVIDKKIASAPAKSAPATELDLDALMDELSGGDEIVRVKEITLDPLTEEEALTRLICWVTTSLPTLIAILTKSIFCIAVTMVAMVCSSRLKLNSI